MNIPKGVLYNPGEYLSFRIVTKNGNNLDKIEKFSIRLTNQEHDHLFMVFNGVPGTQPKELIFSAKKTESVDVYYKEIFFEFVKDCEKNTSKITIFQDFAVKILQNQHQYNCTKVCIPLQVEQILNTVQHQWNYCPTLKDYYCMQSDETMDKMYKISQTSVKSCLDQFIKINRDLVLQAADHDNSGKLWIYVNLGAYQQVYQEYYVRDTLGLIGTAGGILGLFIGFSFYDAFNSLVKFFFDKCLKP